MSTHLVSERESSLVFVWDQPGRRRLAITGFVLASLVLHAMCFYIFQIIYPPAVALLPPPGRATIIAPNSDEGRVLLRWLEAEDPALASTTQPPAGGKSLAMPTIQHAPSYLARQPALREIPPLPPDPAVPSGQPPAPIAPPRAPNQMVAKITPTMVRLSPELEAPDSLPRPEMKFTASRHELPQAGQFRIAVDETGAVRYCFVTRSSGDAALDEQARQYLALYRISVPRSPASETRDRFVWGTATVEWGNDIAAPSSPAKSVAP